MITHILNDGTVLKDITGHVVKQEDAKEAYQLIKDRRKDANHNGHNHQ